MAGRPVDHRRRAELLDAAVDHAALHGFDDLSWRTIAAALGVSTATLMHHFGSREEFLAAILDRLRGRIADATQSLAGDDSDLASLAGAIWAWTSAPEQQPTFRLFFAVYGHALQYPARHSTFLEGVGTHWQATLVAVQGPDVDPVTAARTATYVMATLRGLLLDLLSGRSEDRVRDAAAWFLKSL